MGKGMVKEKDAVQSFEFGYFQLVAGMENVLFLVLQSSHESGLVGAKESSLFQRPSPCKRCEREMVSALEFVP